MATVLVQNGTLKQGDTIIAGEVSGKIRALVNDKGKNVMKAGPSVPVEVVGFDDLPEAGDIFYVTDEKPRDNWRIGASNSGGADSETGTTV